MTDPITLAQRLASNHVTAFQSNQRAYWNAKLNGIAARPAMGSQPATDAVSGAEYITALGAANVAALDAAYGTSAPSE